ncbi:MAG: hypothetical protein RL732_486 [Bacteroidota bacterium]|jgi:hypothetical protein
MQKYRSVFLLVGALVCCSWGFMVHRTVAQLAIYRLPKSLRIFFYVHKEELVRYSVRPDQRRNTDSLEAPRHYIDLEPFGDSSAWKMPMDRATAMQKIAKDTLFKYGYVPYHIQFIKDKLTEAMRAERADSILFYAADLSHYISDAHVPLHTTINYDGQLSGQKGLHALWETVVPENDFNRFVLKEEGRAHYIDDIPLAAWTAIREAYQLLPEVLRAEQEVTRQFTDSTKYRIQYRNGKTLKFYTADFAKAYHQMLGETVNRQLIRSASLIADFFYTCWVDAGRPDLSQLSAPEYTGAVKQQQRAERKAYRRDELREKNLLIAVKNNPGAD